METGVLMRFAHVILALAIVPLAAVSAEQSGSEVPPMDQTMEPEIVITPKEQGRIKEYRVNGQLYMIEIVPVKGAPYYLIDNDGDGLLESRQNHLEPALVVPRWTLLRW